MSKQLGTSSCVEFVKMLRLVDILLGQVQSGQGAEMVFREQGGWCQVGKVLECFVFAF